MNEDKTKENKLQTIFNLFECHVIRSIWDGNKEDCYFSVVDVISALTDSINQENIGQCFKVRLKNEESQVTTNCSQLKMLASDNKLRMRDALDTEEIFRLIDSVKAQKQKYFVRNGIGIFMTN